MGVEEILFMNILQKNVACFQAPSSLACTYAATDREALSFMSSPDGTLGFRTQPKSLEDLI